MASQKEYEMLFKLNAQLGSGYNSTFKTAQSAMSQYRSEYQNLSRTATDISGFQRQQTAVENTKSKLALLQQQYNNIQREMDETGNHSSDLENKLVAKKAQIDKTSTALQQQIDKLEAYRQRLSDAGVDTSNLDRESERLKTELDKLRSGYEEAGDGASEFGQKGEDALSNVSDALAALGIAAALKKIYDAYAACVSISADFEESMSTVEALSGATDGELTQLSSKAQELGATTKFTAKESADAMTYMGMAGWGAGEMLSGMNGVLQLAAASGEDLATVSDIVTDSLTAFGLKASDTSHFADVLAAAATNSNTSVITMGETFKMAAPIAGALGYSIEDVSVSVGLMANSGIKGSIAGTSLKNIFNGLLEGVTLTSKAFGEYDFTAVKADGTMLSFSESINELRGYFEQMSAAEQVNNAMTIAGQRGYSGLLAILNSTDADYSSLTDSINNCTGAAQSMAEIKLDNMNGQLTLAKSAWDALEMSIGDQFTPALTDMYEIGADVLAGLTEFNKEHPYVVKGITAIVIGVAAFVIGITGYIVVTKLATKATVALTAAMNTNPYLLLGSAVAGIVVGLVALASTLSATETEYKEVTAATAAHNDKLVALRAEYARTCEEQGEMSEAALNLKYQIEELSEQYESSEQTLEDYNQEVSDLIASLDESRDAHKTASTGLDDEYESTLSLIAKLETLGSTSELAARNQALIVPVIDELNTRYEGLGLTFDALTGKFNKTGDEIREVAKSEHDIQQSSSDWTRYVEAVGESTSVTEKLTTANENLAAATDEYNKRREAYENFKGSSDYIWDLLFNGNLQTLQFKGAMDKASESMAGYKSTVDQLTGSYKELETEVAGYEETYGYSGGIGDENQFITYEDAVKTCVDSVRDEIDALCVAYDEAYTSAKETIDGEIGLFDTLKTESETTTSGMIEAWQTQIDYLTRYTDNIRKAQEYGLDVNLISQLSDGTTESAGNLDVIIQKIEGLGTTSSEAKGFISEFNKSFEGSEEAKEEWAATVASMETEFDTKMTEIQTRLDTAIDDMNMDSEAAKAAKSTMDAYAQAIRDGTTDAVTAATKAAAAVSSALAQYSGTGTTIPGHAAGTDNAERGFAVVGENGPELMYFNGGEKILNAVQTAALVRNTSDVTPIEAASRNSESSTVIHFAPVYELSGASNAEEVRAILKAHDEEMAAQLKELLAEERDNAERRAYV